MKHFFYFLILILCCSANPPGLKTSKYQGIYGYKMKGGNYAYSQVIIYPETDKTVLFYFDSNIGEPSYSMGALYGRLKIVDGSGTFTNGDCECRFDFKNGNLVLKPNFEKLNCGFGHGVMMQGTFKRESKKHIERFTNLEGKEIFFGKTKPEEYKND